MSRLYRLKREELPREVRAYTVTKDMIWRAGDIIVVPEDQSPFVMKAEVFRAIYGGSVEEAPVTEAAPAVSSVKQERASRSRISAMSIKYLSAIAKKPHQMAVEYMQAIEPDFMSDANPSAHAHGRTSWLMSRGLVKRFRAPRLRRGDNKPASVYVFEITAHGQDMLDKYKAGKISTTEYAPSYKRKPRNVVLTPPKKKEVISEEPVPVPPERGSDEVHWPS